MVVTYWYLYEEHYDYFGGHSHKFLDFDTLAEAFKEYKRLQKLEYRYTDGGFYKIDPPSLIWDFSLDPQRPHSRSKREWEKLQEDLKRKEENSGPYDMDLEDIII